MRKISRRKSEVKTIKRSGVQKNDLYEGSPLVMSPSNTPAILNTKMKRRNGLNKIHLKYFLLILVSHGLIFTPLSVTGTPSMLLKKCASWSILRRVSTTSVENLI